MRRLILSLVVCVFCLAREAAHYPEILPSRCIEGFIQSSSSSFFDDRCYITLDNSTGWVIYRLYGNSAKWWKFLDDINEVDRRLICNPSSWSEGDQVQVYSFPFRRSLAMKILENPGADLQEATHLIYNREKSAMAFAKRLTREELEDKDLEIKPIKVLPNKGLRSRFSDIVGLSNVKEEAREIVRCLKNPKPYLKLGASLPQGLFISGPPGCGKTMLAKALAKEAQRTLIQISGDVFWDEIFLKGANWIEPLFEAARAHTPCVILVDGFDTFDFVRHFVVYHFLVKRLKREIELMDGEQDMFLVITARDIKNMGEQFLNANHGCQILEVTAPSKKDRTELLKRYAKGFVLDKACDLALLGHQTLCFTPTDLKEVFNVGARIAAMKKAEVLVQTDLEKAIRRISRIKAEHAQSQDNPAKLSDPFTKQMTFADVGGCKEAKEELQELVAFLKNPSQFSHLGAKAPKGTLCIGPPGCGKTLLAKAVAGEAGCNFFHCSGADFNDIWVGSGVNRIKEVFQMARTNSPAILFIDEIDAVGGKRMRDPQAAARDFNNTLNQLLVEMDGFDATEGVAVIGATNLPDMLDEALLRSGRFDRQIVIDRPGLEERLEILKIQAKSLPLKNTVDLTHIARMTLGMSGADLANVLNESALIAGRLGKTEIEAADLREAHDKVQLGKERKSLKLSEEEKRHTAYHEAGHTIVSLVLNPGFEVDKVTIVPRGNALGLTHYIPTGENVTLWKQQAEDQLASCLGGLAAERICLGDISAGVSGDLKQATELARQMVSEYGMSEALGFASFGHDLSPETKRLIDIEVRKLLDTAYSRARAIIEEYREQMEQIASDLLEKETLYRADLDAILLKESEDEAYPAA